MTNPIEIYGYNAELLDQLMRPALRGGAAARSPSVVCPSSAPRLESDAQRYAALLEMADVVSRRRDLAEALLESEELLGAYFRPSRVGF